MQSSKILLKDGQTVDLVDNRIDDGDIASWNNKPNVTITSENDSVNISTSVDAETNTKTFDLSVDSLNITSSDGSINVSTSKGVTDLTLPSDVVRDSAYTHIDASTANPLMNGTAAVGVSTKYAREDHVHPSDTSKEDIVNKTTVVLGTSDSKYPTDKAVAEFVNSSIATNTANYISNNGEPFTSVEQLEAYSGPVTNNDYAFVTGIDSEGNTYYDRYKATVSGETVTWALEYRLNNSSFTAAQWSAINSGITSALVAKIHDHSNKDVLDGITSTDVANWNSKQDSLPTSGTASSTYAINISGNSTSANNWHGEIYGTAKSAKTKRYVYLGRKKRSDYGCLIGILTVCSHTDSKDVYVIGSGWSSGNFGNDASVQRISSGRTDESINICLYNHEITENDTVYSELWCYIPTYSGEVDFIFRTLFNFGGKMTLAASVVNRAKSEFTGTLTKCANSNSRNIAYSPTNTAVGSASVPVYVTNSGAVTACMNDFVHDGDVTSTYSPTGTAPVNGKAIAAAISGLDGIAAGTESPLMDGKASVGNSLKYAREDHVHPTDSNKLNVNGLNATTEGVVAMMKKVKDGSADLTDDSYYFGDSNRDHTKIVRRPILNIWNFFAPKVDKKIVDRLGSVGSEDKPIYLDNGVPKVCADGVPYSSVSYGGNVGYGVFVGGAHNLANSTRLYCTFLVTAALYNDNIAHTYIGTFTFRGGILNCELKCLTGTPAYPLRITVVYNKDGKDSNGNPTYTVGLYVIPPDKTTKYSGYQLTRISSTSDFIWDVKNISEATYDECNSVAKPALKPIILTWDANASNVKTTGGTWIPTFDKATIIDCRGIVDMSIQVDMSIIGQRTYVDTLSSYEITLVNSSETDILPESLHQTGRMPRQAYSSSSTIDGTIDISHTHRFIFPITSTSNLLAGYRPKITLPSRYTLDSGAQVNIKALCRGIVLPYGADEYF